jgi:hypothetical protein
MLLTEIESTGIGRLISSSSKMLQEEKLIDKNMYAIVFILISR